MSSAAPSGDRIRTSRAAMALVAFAVVAAGALALGQRWVPSSAAIPDAPRKVLVVGTGPLGFDDLQRGWTPRLDALMEGDAAVAAMSTRTLNRRSNLEEGYLSLGAGFRLRGDSASSVAYDATELAALPDVGPEAPIDAPEPVRVVGADAAVERNDRRSVTSKPGALAEALHATGHTIAVVGNADDIDPLTGAWSPRRPAALAAMDADLDVDAGVVGRAALLEADPEAPFGVRADVGAVTAAAVGLLADHDVVLVDPGDLARFERWEAIADDGTLTKEQVDAAHDTALARTDEVLGSLVDGVGDDVLVLAVSLDAGGSGFHLTPAAFTGAGAAPGYLVSPSTKREGVIAITDLAPTILDAVGVEVPEDFPGNAIRYGAGSTDLEHLRDLDRDTAFRESTYGDWVSGFISFTAAVYALGLLVLLTPAPPRWAVRLATGGALLSAGFPLATFLFRAIPGSFEMGDAAILAVLGIDAVVVAVASRFRRTPLMPLQVVIAATVALILLDASTGTPLHVNSWLGYSLHGGGRFYGVPNTTYGLLAAGAILLAATVVGHARRRREALLVAALGLGLVVIIDGAPSLGGDVGGIVSLIPVFALVLLALLGQKVRWRSIVAIGTATAAVLGAAIAVDLSRPEDARTHLGRFASRVFEGGPGELVDTFVRKQQANIDILQGSTWVRMVLLTVAVLVVVLAPRARRDVLVPRGSAAFVGLVGTLAGAVVGFLANDSGPIVLGLFATFLLPYVVLPALAAVRAAGPPGADVEAGPAPVRRPEHPADPVGETGALAPG